MNTGRLHQAVVLAGLALAALGGPPSVVAADVLKFGAPLPLTGPLSPEGIKQKNGYDLWAEVANAAGGVTVGNKRYSVEVVYADYASNTPRAVQLAEKLITEDGVNFLFSPFGSGATKAASGVSEKYGIPTIAATASSTAVYDQGYRFLFGTFTPNITLAEPLAQLVKAGMPDVKKVAIVARNDLFPLAIANVMEQAAKAHGFDVDYFEKYSIGTLDHASALAQMRLRRPDWVIATGYVNDLILIRKQMADQGVRAKVVTMIAGPAYKEYVDALGPLAENVSSAAWWHPSVRYSGETVFGSTANYNALFEKKFGVVPDYTQASSSVAGCLFQLAIERAGSIDPGTVRDTLASMQVNTFFGPVKFGENGQITSLEPPVFQVSGGKQVVVHPPAIKQADLEPVAR